MEAIEKSTITAAQETQRKNVKYLADYKKIFEYFSFKPATMFQCEIDTGILRPYVCWCVRNLRRNGDIQIFKFGCCPISRFNGAQLLTTDKNLFKSPVKQPTLFNELWP
jgi:hypothetical protein